MKNKLNLLNDFEKLIKLENIYEKNEIDLCYEYLNKDELIEKGIVLTDLIIKDIKNYNKSTILKLVKKKKDADINNLSDENLDNLPNNLLTKGSIVHFSKKRKKYNINNDINIYVCIVNKIKKTQVSIIIKNINDLCKELNITNIYLLQNRGYFDIALINSEITAIRQIDAIKLMKQNMNNPNNILKILFYMKKPSHNPFLNEILKNFDKFNLIENVKNENDVNSIENEENENENDVNSIENEENENDVNNIENEENENENDINNIEYEKDDINDYNYFKNNYIYKCNKQEWNNKKLNLNQKKSIYYCLYSNDIFCIQGPPGTGKTTVLCELVYQLILKNNNYKILITSSSNVSVDNILSKLVNMKLNNVVRFGLKHKVKKELWNYCYDEKIKQCDSYKMCIDIDNEINNLKEEINKIKKKDDKNKKKKDKYEYLNNKKEINNIKYNIKLLNRSKKKKQNIFFKELINKNNIFLSTCSSTSNYELKKYSKEFNFLFDIVCIDECCQCTEPLSYIPILFAKTNLFLFGDHKQLSPLVKYNKDNNKLNITLFERLVKRYKNKINFVLNIQYRMNKNIMRWSNKIFYHNKLVADDTCKNIIVEDLINNNNNLILNNIEKKNNEKTHNNKYNKKIKKKKNKIEKNDKNNKNNKNINLNNIIKNYDFLPIIWIETDGFDEFLDDTNNDDMINEEKEKNKKKNENNKKENENIKRENILNDENNINENILNDENNINDNILNNEKQLNEENNIIIKNNSLINEIKNINEDTEDELIETRLLNENDEELKKYIKINIDDIINLNNKSRCNNGEAYVIYKLIERFVYINKIDTKNICVIAPYSKQVNLLKQILHDNLYNHENYINEFKNIEISTVDSFQGREKEIVIFSLVCSNYFKNIGFLKDYRRLNVAITRAKRHFVIIGNSNTISDDKVLNELYETISSNGKVYLVNELIDVENIIYC